MLVLVGFIRPENPRYPKAVLPEGVECWSSDQVSKPHDKTFLETVTHVYFNSGISGPVKSELSRLFGFLPKPMSGIGNLKLQLERIHSDIAKKVLDFLAEPAAPAIDEKVLKLIPGRAWGVGPTVCKSKG